MADVYTSIDPEYPSSVVLHDPEANALVLISSTLDANELFKIAAALKFTK
jgi:hypothetical protein